MNKNFSPGFRKAAVTLLVTVSSYASCTKGYDPGNLFSDRIATLTGQPGSVNWVLTTIFVNNAADTSAKGTRKLYRPDGTFVDDLGFTGYWTLYSRDSLIESTRSCVNTAAPYFTNHFRIERLDQGRLRLTTTHADKTIRFEYVSNR